MKYSYSYYNEEDFDNYVKQFDNYSLLQSREWGAVKSPIWKNKKVLFYEDEKVVGTALILIREIALKKTLFTFLTDHFLIILTRNYLTL